MDIQLLDCTLRDGGFLNQWKFGAKTIKSYIHDISKTCVDIVECGYLAADSPSDAGLTKYASVSDLSVLCHSRNHTKQYVCMIDYGKYPQEAIPECAQAEIDGLRVAFRMEDMTNAYAYCKTLKAKGYQVLIQPMNISTYSKSAFSDLLSLCNLIEPYAIYIVDSFGLMWPDSLRPYIDIADNIIGSGIKLGFHFHNNLQQALVNAVYVLSLDLQHSIILDASFCGAGRGGGNLDFFALLPYLIHNKQTLPVTPFLEIADNTLKTFVHESIHNNSIIPFLTASHGCHPNYGTFLAQIQNLSYTEIDKILSIADPFSMKKYDEAYISQLYHQFKNV